MSWIAVNVRVRGRVQGVFFRAWSAEKARSLGVTGWVRNLPDGSVQAHLEGDEPAVQQLLEKLRQGPPAAQVNKVDVEAAEPEDAKAFEVRH